MRNRSCAVFGASLRNAFGSRDNDDGGRVDNGIAEFFIFGFDARGRIVFP